MKKFIVIFLFFFLSITPAFSYVVGSPPAMLNQNWAQYAVDPSAADQGAASTTNVTLKNVIDAVGTGEIAVIVFPHNGAANTTAYTLSTAETVPSNFYLDIQPGAIIKPGSGISLTVYRPENIIAQPNQQIFDISSNSTNPLQFSVGGRIYGRWWGLNADGATSDSTALQCALDSIYALGGTLKLTEGVYLVDDTLYLKNSATVRAAYGVRIEGEGFQTCLYMPSGSDNIFEIQYYWDGAADNRNTRSFYLGNLSFYGGTTGTAIYASHMHSSKIENVFIKTSGTGLYMLGCTTNFISRLIIGADVVTQHRPGYAAGIPSGGAVGGTPTYGVYLDYDDAVLTGDGPISSENTFSDVAIENCTNDGIKLDRTYHNVFTGTSKGHTGYAIASLNGSHDEFNIYTESCTGNDSGYGAGSGTTALYISGAVKNIFHIFGATVNARILGGSTENTFIGCQFEDVDIESNYSPNIFIGCRIDGTFTDLGTVGMGQLLFNLTGELVTNTAMASIAGNMAWDNNKKQLKLYNGTYWEYFGREPIVPKTDDYIVLTTDSNRIFTNGGASKNIVFTLPAATDYYGPMTFTNVTGTHTIQIDPNGSNYITGGGAGKYCELDAIGDSITIRIIASGIWQIISSYGTPAFEG